MFQIIFDNTSKISEQCELSLENNKIFLPQISTEEDETLDLKLRNESEAGLENHLKKLF